MDTGMVTAKSGTETGKAQLTVRLVVPKKFFEDHCARELVLHSGDRYVVKSTSRDYTVELHPRDAYDLINDAHFYSDNGDPDQNTGLMLSARATVKRIHKQYDLSTMQSWRKAGECATYEAGDWCPTCGRKSN